MAATAEDRLPVLRRVENRRNVEQRRFFRLPIVREPEHWRPATRAECVDLPRPCPYVGCRYHLAIEVTARGDIAHIGDPAEMAETCALDIADRGGITLEKVGEIYDVTRERVRQIEAHALWKLERDRRMREMRSPG